MPVEYKPNIKASGLVKAAITAAVRDAFAQDVVPEAKRLSPVTPEGLEYNLAKGKKGTEAKGTGENRRSIDFEMTATPEGPKAEMYTQSGYGGWLEVGTSKMRAQPYLWPALLRWKDDIIRRIRERLSR